MPDHINIRLEELLLFEGDELIFDGSDPSTYTVLELDTGAADLTGPDDWDCELGGATDGTAVFTDADPGL